MFKHTHLEAIGEIRERNPWIEDTWRLFGFCLVHWQNLKAPGYASGPTPRHVWRLMRKGAWSLHFHHGIAPRYIERIEYDHTH